MDEVKSKTKGGKITLLEMDNESLASVKKAADFFLSQSRTLNILINNAGVMATPKGKTKDGLETQFGTNHVAHFYLFQLLKDTLLASATPDFPSRVVSVSSFGHRTGPVRVDDYNFEKEEYSPWLSYGQAKTANIWFANETERRYGSKGLHATSLHPGGIWTGLQVHVDMSAAAENEQVKNYMKNTEQGAATSVYAALGDEWKNKGMSSLSNLSLGSDTLTHDCLGGRYLSDCIEQGPFKNESDPMFVGDDGYATWAYDEQGEKRLWQDSLHMVGLKDDQ